MGFSSAVAVPAVGHRFLDVRGLRLHLADLGGEGRPVLFLHGVTSHWGSWLPLAARLASVGRLVALDFRGHGDSQWSADEAYATNDLADDAVAVLEWLGSPADVVGSSWGGLVGLEAAGRRPDLIRSLVMIDIPPSFSQDEHDVPPRPESYADPAEVVAWERGRSRFATDETVALLAALGTRPGPDGRLYPRHDPFFLARWPFRADDRWAQLDRVDRPVLVVRGGASPNLPPDTAQRVVAALPHGAYAEVADAGHLVHVDAPDALAAGLRAFWDRLS